MGMALIGGIRKDMVKDAVGMLEAAGLKNVNGLDANLILGRGIHEMVSARMRRNFKTSVLNTFNQLWDAPMFLLRINLLWLHLLVRIPF